MIRKIIKKFITILAILVLSACSENEIENRVQWKVKDFSYINQDNQPLNIEDLKGKVWVADFIFTNCETVCPTLTFNMAKLQQMLKNEGIIVELVSFSVDPKVDTPEKLKEYATQFNVDFKNWHFLTGYEQEEIKDLALESFKTIVQDDPNSNQVVHGTSYYLVDKEGNVAKDYSGTQEVPYDQIIKDIKSLIK
ncbi:protein SCO1/2 [Cytobacillus firmus]|uniref:Protein SCO1/2 n=2 Tax=Cytobacillus TaxID=2675230 RepID=A0A366JI77_CYTFI|nr:MULTISPECIES: SCO family protein [Cytobacillus]RBP86186.1 protein SCO1/2 [Cytobacillus firmus]TDX36401.1 protein SCO1/2 [Cytobacillus oceanisediminis]